MREQVSCPKCGVEFPSDGVGVVDDACDTFEDCTDSKGIAQNMCLTCAHGAECHEPLIPQQITDKRTA